MVYRLTIVGAPYISMTRKRNNAFALYCAVCKLRSLPVVANLFTVLHACTLCSATVVCQEISFAIWSVEHYDN